MVYGVRFVCFAVLLSAASCAMLDSTAGARPVVNAGADQRIQFPATATLRGTATAERTSRKPLSTRWSQMLGPARGVLAHADATTTTATFPICGTYVFRLEATDGEVHSADEVVITVITDAGVPPGSIVVNPGNDIQATVNNAPAGTVIYLTSGHHRLQSVTPKDGNIFIGEQGAIVSGAKPLVSFVAEDKYWVANNQLQGPGPRVGNCQPTFRRCTYPEDLFFDDVPLKHVASRSVVGPGTWHFDYENDRIYIGNDPRQHSVETSVRLYAFLGTARNVIIKGLIVEKYANPAQSGAIFGTSTHDWTIEDAEVRWNHGVGIRSGDGMSIVRCFIHHNGQLGVGGSGNGILLQDSEIAYNNYAGYYYGWEAGGTKFVRTTDLVIRNNDVHHNDGPGLWTDYENRNSLYESNHTSNNKSAGILHEVSGNVIIRFNVVENDGYSIYGSSLQYGAGILVVASSHVEIYGNTVANCVNGIGARQLRRGTYDLQDLYVHDNIVRQQDGVAAGVDTQFFFNSPLRSNSRWERNTYLIARDSAAVFEWLGRRVPKEDWTAAGNDVHGIFRPISGPVAGSSSESH
jgi:hypothetical protein